MCLIVEILMLIVGLIGLIGGKLTLSKNFPLEGRRARIAGLILALPLPLAFGIGLVLGVLIGTGALPSSATKYASCIDIGAVLAGLGGAIAYAYATKPPAVSGFPPAQPPVIPPMQ
jgi:hypothetical protein